jgi:DnaJ-domain-containing protein 1
VSITRGFADTSNVERVIFLQSALHADSVSHSMSSVSSPRSFMEERFRKAGIRASNSGSVGRHGEHLTTLGLSAAASNQEIKQAYRRLALEVGYIILLPNPSLDIINF